MGRKKQFNSKPTRKELAHLRTKTSTPLEKVSDSLDPAMIIKDDATLVKAHFVSDLMVLHKTTKEIQDALESKFGEPVNIGYVYYLKRQVRLMYVAEITRNRDELVAEELMNAEWELRELKDYWMKSKQGKKKVVKHDADSDGTELTTYELHETTETLEDSYGDLDAMKRIDSVHTRVINLLGLNAPKKKEENEDASNNAITINIVGETRQMNVEEAQVVQ